MTIADGKDGDEFRGAVGPNGAFEFLKSLFAKKDIVSR
ncbi:hypothetical protein J2853_009762 [Streptosporangium lutulentum]|uniref:DUF397 domain-containing protein n=1 Tax=Streptosporangium lutulentum TaxID=1461250 RepID=A0ABT9QUL8_9ACTN|nr:hypothetical protein [Streptosporangium lutulentum]